MVSIVLPTYNGEAYIKDSIMSIIEQTYQDWELIVIDDCSTDNTPVILDHFIKKDKRIHAYRNENNQRLPASLNIGFSKCKGEYLTWTSDDNRYNPEAISEFVKELERDKALGLVFSKMEMIDSSGKQTGKFSDDVVSLEELRYKNIVGASFMYTRTVYEVVGNYDTTKFLVEDYDYWLRIVRCFKIHYIPKVLYQYRIHEGSLTNVKNEEMLMAKIALLEKELVNTCFSTDTLLNIYEVLAQASFSTNNLTKMRYYIQSISQISKEKYRTLHYKLRYSKYFTAKQLKVVRQVYRYIKNILLKNRKGKVNE